MNHASTIATLSRRPEPEACPIPDGESARARTRSSGGDDERRCSTGTVLVVGPPPSMLGGMASVVGQMLDLPFANHYRIVLFPITVAPPGEGRPGQIRRHLTHLAHLRTTILRASTPIVHIHTCSGFSFWRSTLDLWVARACGARVVLHIHGAAFDSFHDAASPAQRWLIRRVLTGADRVIALSQEWQGKLADMAPDACLRVIENAVASPTQVPTCLDNGACRFLLLARMDEWKGIDDLLAAVRIAHDSGAVFEVILAGPPGTAGDADELARKIRDNRLEGVVEYIGPVAGESKDALLRRADAYVLPSHHEGLPIAMLEALAYGLPVVATTVGAVPEVLTHDVHGLLVPPHQPDRLAAAMSQLAANFPQRRAMSHAAVTLIEARFSLGRFEKDLIRLYDEMISADKRRRRCDAGRGFITPQSQRVEASTA